MTKKVPYISTNHGIERIDHYAWVRDSSNPEVISKLLDENQKTEKYLAHLKPLQQKIYDEIISRILEDDEEYPYRLGNFEYFYKMEKGKNYPAYFRKNVADQTVQKILDINDKAAGKSFVHLGSYRMSPNQKMIAYALDFDGSEHYQIFIEDIETKEILDDLLIQTTGNFEWADDSTIYFGRMDETHRPDRILKHSVQSNVVNDYVVYEDADLSYYVGLGKSSSGRYLWIESGSKITTEVSFVDLLSCDRAVQLFSARKENVKYHVEHQEKRFLIYTNENAENFKLLQCPIDHFDKTYWKEAIPYDSNRTIEDVQAFKNYVVVCERYRGNQNFRVLDSKDEIDDISFDEPLYAVGLEHNKVYDSSEVRFHFSSMKTPPRIQYYDMAKKTLRTVKEKIIPGYDPSMYETKRVFAPSRDGKSEIPISVIYKKGFVLDGNAPVFLYGYGSYGMSRNPSFSPTIFSLLDRGFCYAIAHIRGGAEQGRTWYNDGKLLKKKNTFYDFIDAGKFLIEKKYTSAKKIAICGGSAGGLLMGAVINMEPALWGTVVALVPFVDVVNTMLDETLPLTVTEYDEWGNPNDKKYFEYMLSYSPYDNIERQNYPSILATGGLTDPRVGFWEPTKWIFKLRENQASQKPLLIKMQMEAGHQGPSGRYEAYRETAYYYSFVINELGVARS